MTTRRDVLKTLGIGTVAAALAGREARGALPADARPNILWISCEDTGTHLGCYGDTCAKTPNLDRLAAEGVRHTHAFTVAGVCAPSRSGIITGVYPTTLGTHHMRCRATPPKHVKCFPEYFRQAGYYCTNNSKTDYQFPVPKGAWDESSKKAHWRNRPKGKPFFAVFNFTVCHEGGIVRNHQAADPNEKKETLPPYYPDTPTVRRDWNAYYKVITDMDRQAGGILKQLKDDGLSDGTIILFWSDHGVGLPRAKRWLYDSGTRVPLILRMPGKFRVGDQGRPGTVNDELVSFIDLAPTMLNLAGIKIPDHMQGRAFLGKNLAPPRQYVYGARDRMDERYDIIRAVRDKRYRYIRNYEPFKAYYQYMNTPEKGATMKELRRLHAEGRLPPAAERFMADSKPAEELYDLREDPHEIHNLADSPQHQDVLERMRKAHIEWVLETRDLGLIPEADILERREKVGSEYAILRQPGGEKRIARLRAVAALGEEGQVALPKLTAALKDKDAAVRYWAAVGLGNLGKAAKSAAALLDKTLQDRSDSVRIAAARALCLMDAEADALPALGKELKSPRQWVRLSAALVLDEIGEKLRPAEAALDEALKDKQNKYVVRVANHALNIMRGTNNTVR